MSKCRHAKNSKLFNLIIQIPKNKKIGTGILNIDLAGTAYMFSDNGQILAEMHRIKIDIASSRGILLSGIEPDGYDKSNRLKYVYQQWWLEYT